MFQVVAFNTVQATFDNEGAAEAKRASLQRHISACYMGGDVSKVTVRKVAA